MKEKIELLRIHLNMIEESGKASESKIASMKTLLDRLQTEHPATPSPDIYSTENMD